MAQKYHPVGGADAASGGSLGLESKLGVLLQNHDSTYGRWYLGRLLAWMACKVQPARK